MDIRRRTLNKIIHYYLRKIVLVIDSNGITSTVIADFDNVVFNENGRNTGYTDIWAISAGLECEIFFGEDGKAIEITLIYPNNYEGTIMGIDFVHIVGIPHVTLKISFPDGTTDVYSANPDIADFNTSMIGKYCKFTLNSEGVINSITFE